MSAKTVADRLKELGFISISVNEGSNAIDGIIKFSETVAVQVGTFDGMVSVVTSDPNDPNCLEWTDPVQTVDKLVPELKKALKR